MMTNEAVKKVDNVLGTLERINSAHDLSDAKGHAGEARHELRKLREDLTGNSASLSANKVNQ